MPDAPALQKQFGQSGQQAPGCGFPVAHVLGLFDLHTGLVARLTVSPMRTHARRAARRGAAPVDGCGRPAAGRRRVRHLRPFAPAFTGELARVVPGTPQARLVDFAPGRARTTEGKDAVAGMTRAPSGSRRSGATTSQIVEWFKPKERPDWIAAPDYAALPDTIRVRETRRTVALVALDDGRHVTSRSRSRPSARCSTRRRTRPRRWSNCGSAGGPSRSTCGT
jgi:hypothetical protein